ncbi:LuxR C-terminal-related transcriptional regulator [Microbacterium sp. A204]|uniref:LuxR C-terminal-related transcriptional regulator n=1 Tax=Microbacterium sp. A204 TaxID=3457321 RepID=UPI003FD6909F
MLAEQQRQPATTYDDSARATSRRLSLPALWEHMIGPALEAIDDSAPRALVVGNAGSGKSTTLRHLHSLLTERARDAVYMRPGPADITEVPRSRVLIVDDLHRLGGDQLAQLRIRAADPDASLIVALRPARWDDTVAEISQHLEQHHPSVVLGHVSRADLLTHLSQHDLRMSEACLSDILEITGGVSWLVSEALRAHDDRDCRGGAAHSELRMALEERIAHRLSMTAPGLRAQIERICVSNAGMPDAADESGDHALHGYAEGLLLRNGQPVPLVRITVQAGMPAGRLIALDAAVAHIAGATPGDPSPPGEVLIRYADTLLPTHPKRAAELYEGAIRSGEDASLLAGRRAEAAWAAGDLDTASALVDEAGPLTGPSAGAHDRDRLADTTAAIWAARGMMEQAHTVYQVTSPSGPLSAARARIASLGIGIASDTAADAPTTTEDSAIPSTLGVAMRLLRRGLDASLAPEQAEPSLSDLVRASEMYTTSHEASGIPELPAVIAAIVALNLGALATASSVIDDAIAGGQGGPWARPRLLLWRAWIAVELARPGEARDALASATAARSPRDLLLADAVRVAIARRYEDAAGLEAAWRRARASLLRVDVDLYLLHPLAELISSASRVGDPERIRPQFERALQLVNQLHDPALWSAHLRWAGIQNGILLNSPESLRPHAKALVEASAHSRIASTMAKAGRVWTSVLGGTVEAEAVEKAAEDLASIGLVWDGARLAGHGAARSQDRKVSARLLACARELHPIDGSRRAMAAKGGDATTPTKSTPQEVLSERELEVARLVIEGKTYAEIGETIFISPRTAEHHIAHIRRRLGASSRSEMLAQLRQLIGTDRGAGTPHPGEDGTPP